MNTLTYKAPGLALRSPVVADVPPSTPPGPPPELPTLDQLFSDSIDRIVTFEELVDSGEPNLKERFRSESTQTKRAFLDEVAGIDSLPTTVEQAQTATLQALSAGLMAGALDGAIVLSLRDSIEPLSPEQQSLDGAQKLDFEEQWRDIEEALKRAGISALKTASHGLRVVADKEVDFAANFVDAHRLPPAVYRASLMSAFATGYASAAVDSALVLKADVPPEELN